MEMMWKTVWRSKLLPTVKIEGCLRLKSDLFRLFLLPETAEFWLDFLWTCQENFLQSKFVFNTIKNYPNIQWKKLIEFVLHGKQIVYFAACLLHILAASYFVINQLTPSKKFTICKNTNPVFKPF
jgi:hypothetical protein